MDRRQEEDLVVEDDLEKMISLCRVVGCYIFRSDKLLGKGAEGNVFECYNTSKNHKKECMKMVRVPKNMEFQEYGINRILSKSICPNIVPVTDIFKVEDGEYNVWYMVMEWCESSLQKKIQQKNHFSNEEVIDFIRQMASALSCLEKNQIIHLDIKPDNILILKRKYLLADFGVAINLDGKTPNDPELAKYLLQGNIAFRPPETIMEIESRGDISNYYKRDVWAIGVIAYNLLFNGKDPSHLKEYRKSQQVLKNFKVNVENKEIAKVVYQELHNDFKISSKYKLDNKILKIVLEGMLHPDPHKRMTAQQILDTLDGKSSQLEGNDLVSSQVIPRDEVVFKPLPPPVEVPQMAIVAVQNAPEDAKKILKNQKAEVYMKRLVYLRSIATELHRYHDYTKNEQFADFSDKLKFIFLANEYNTLVYLRVVVFGIFKDLIDFDDITNVIDQHPQKKDFRADVLKSLKETSEEFKKIIARLGARFFDSDPSLQDDLELMLKKNSFQDFKKTWHRVDKLTKDTVQQFSQIFEAKIRTEPPYCIMEHLLSLVINNFSLFKSKREYLHLGLYVYTFKMEQHFKNLTNYQGTSEIRSYIQEQEKTVIS